MKILAKRIPLLTVLIALQGLGVAGLAHAAAPAASQRTLVESPGSIPVELYSEEKGSGPPVLLIHGLGASTFAWRYIAPGLTSTHHVISLDLKGFGRSAKPPGDAYTAADQALLVADFIRKRNLSGLTLVGHSFGGAVAARTAVLLNQDKGRIARLVLIDAPVLSGSVPHYFNFVLTPGVPDALLLPLTPHLVARFLLEGSRLKSPAVPEADIEGYAAPYEDPAAKSTFLATARAIVGDRDTTLTPKLKVLTQPVLIVWCRRDDIVPLSAGRKLVRVFSKARLRVLSGCRHLPQDERPEALIAVLQQFLAE